LYESSSKEILRKVKLTFNFKKQIDDCQSWGEKGFDCKGERMNIQSDG
jgi:hypothetical protein